MLADYFLTISKQRIDRLKVYELLMYHDLVEIDAGDTPLSPTMERKNKIKLELNAVKSVSKRIPNETAKKFSRLFLEFEENRTIEARFAKAIDNLDAEIHELDYKSDWKGWTEKFLRKSKEKYFVGFPKLKTAFEEVMKHLKKNDFLDDE